MKIRFNLKPSKNGYSLILLKVRYLSSETFPFVFSINESIPVQCWDARAMRCRAGKGYPQHTWVNAKLDRYENTALDFIRQQQVMQGRAPSYPELRAHLVELKNSFEGRATVAAGNEVEGFILNMASRYTTGTGRHFKSLLASLVGFSASTRRRLDWKAFDLDFFEGWQQWNFNKGYSQNYIQVRWKKLKQVLSEAADRGLYKGSDHKRRHLSISPQKGDDVWNTPVELMKIYDLDLAGSHLDKYRDIYLLNAFCGAFRPGDLKTLDRGKIIRINDRSSFKLHARKTDTPVFTASSWYLDEFLTKYKGDFPVLNDVVFNRNIKKIGEMAGLGQMVSLRKNRGGVDYYDTKPKYAYMTIYTARYSLATNLALNGMSLNLISKLLGHSTVKTTETYIKSSQMDAAVAASDNPYFTTKPAASNY